MVVNRVSCIVIRRTELSTFMLTLITRDLFVFQVKAHQYLQEYFDLKQFLGFRSNFIKLGATQCLTYPTGPLFKRLILDSTDWSLEPHKVLNIKVSRSQALRYPSTSLVNHQQYFKCSQLPNQMPCPTNRLQAGLVCKMRRGYG
jgi:hypothetical protein